MLLGQRNLVLLLGFTCFVDVQRECFIPFVAMLFMVFYNNLRIVESMCQGFPAVTNPRVCEEVNRCIIWKSGVMLLSISLPFL